MNTKMGMICIFQAGRVSLECLSIVLYLNVAVVGIAAHYLPDTVGQERLKGYAVID